ncbi:hypothetical protein [Nocardioides sp.]|uniref:hypothetical protein n=1 Tax=Nocardioides sp. TaxID=35761 RepID=UPI002735A618|nr:hypothetical protein [Nocardioides sp.]MDP3893636.1 hypothetical protein [Nocardioides sp.]
MTAQVGQDNDVPLRRLGRVAIGVHLGELTQRHQQWRADGTSQTGAAEYEIEQTVDVSLDYEADSHPPVVPVVEVDVCADVSDVDVLDAEGNSVIAAERLDQVVLRIRAANYEWPEDPNNGWRVLSLQNTEEACDRD